MSTLIVYSSKHGTTEKVVERLKDKLEQPVKAVNVSKEKNVDWDSWDKVIIGGPIYVGNLKSDLKIFVERHLEKILEKKIGLFICCMYHDDAAAEQFNHAYSDALLAAAQVDGWFGGEVHPWELSLLEKTVVRMVDKGVLENAVLDLDEVDRFAGKMNAI
ncbi:flavodoxin domain-containing protein [Anaerotalea alkaliphila]|uniref:Flavodoxin-like domain-containing protein n=1 Tax=Anaerotalea alkaliphila TaxID=2662126 RepID=A0A7X5HWK9_9FIRM|nr:flavodoxin domain-containing protein [Anaerotalea alkaliphila]NDL67990.1 hypothetical protein [Anaerotalea alkaliphila]